MPAPYRLGFACTTHSALTVALAEAAPKHAHAVEAIFDFAAVDSRYLALVKGVMYTVTSQIDANWYQGANASGKEGIFPINRVKDVEVDAEAPKRKRGDEAKEQSKRPQKFSYKAALSSVGIPSVSLYNPALPSVPSGPPDDVPLPFDIRKKFVKGQNVFFYENVRTKELMPLPPTSVQVRAKSECV